MNIKIGRIFRRKWLESVKVQMRAIRLVVDWTVALYIVIPAIVILAFQYAEWLSEPPAWTESVPSFTFAVLLAISVCLGHIRWYLDDADALFLLQEGAWIKKIKLRGAILSIAEQTMRLGVIFALLYPLFHHHLMFDAQGFVFAAIYQLLTLAVSCYIHDFTGWKRVALKIVSNVFAISFFLLLVWVMHTEKITGLMQYVLISLIFFAAVWLIYHRTAKKYYFPIDAEVDHHLKMKLPAMFLAQTISRKESKLRRPWLFRQSKPIVSARTPENIYGEIAVKAFYRDSHKRKLFLGVVGAGSVAIMLTPLVLKPLVFLMLQGLFIPIINLHGKDLRTSDFSESLLQHQEESEILLYRGRSILNRWIHVPAFAIFSAVFLLSLFFHGILRLLQV